jgi:hypothetical protein
LLDTGASWSIVNSELADELGLFDRDGEPVDMSSRMGVISGKLVRAVTKLVAEDGESVEVDSTLFVSRDWPAGNFIGYSGLLERDPICGRSRHEFVHLRRAVSATTQSTRAPAFGEEDLSPRST